MSNCPALHLQDQYYHSALHLLEDIYQQESAAILNAAKAVAKAISGGGLLHIFGCGHSHILAEDAFYRAGGLVPVNPILDSAVMLHDGAVKSSAVERMSGYAKHIIDRHPVHPGDAFLVFSTSGINALPIEMAAAAREKGAYVIAVTSMAYRDAPSRHPNGLHLFQAADLVIDNHVPHGDAIVHSDALNRSIAPCSTILCSMILNMIVAQTAEELIHLGVEPQYFCSGNVAGGRAYNQQYIDQYMHRIPAL